MNSRPYSNGELPYRRPSAIFPSLSPAVIQSICRPSSIHFATLSTGTICFAPLFSAVAIVEVARNTSIMTTVAWDTLYKCSKAGDRDVCKKGLVFGIGQNKFNKKSFHFFEIHSRLRKEWKFDNPGL